MLLPEIFRGPWAIALLVIAMGLQNPQAQRLGLALSTTFITGDMLRFAEGLVGRVVRRESENLAPFAICGLAWLGYAAGAAGLAVLPWPLVIPALALGVVYALARRAGKLSTSGL